MPSAAELKPHPQAKEIISEFKPQISELHSEIGGKINHIHNCFNNIAVANGRPPLPAQAVAHVQEVFPRLKQPLTDLHAKLEGKSDGLYAWFLDLLPQEAHSQFSQTVFLGAVMKVKPGSPTVPLNHFLAAIEANMDESDSFEKINDVITKHLKP